MNWQKLKATKGARAARHKDRNARGTMNRLEQQRADELEVMKARGAILEYRFEPFRLRLTSPGAEIAGYTPDFMVVYPDGRLEIEEVKGFFEEAAMLRIKVAADLYPWQFVSLQRRAKKDGGGWERRVFKGWASDELDDAVGREPAEPAREETGDLIP